MSQGITIFVGRVQPGRISRNGRSRSTPAVGITSNLNILFVCGQRGVLAARVLGLVFDALAHRYTSAFKTNSRDKKCAK